MLFPLVTLITIIGSILFFHLLGFLLRSNAKTLKIHYELLSNIIVGLLISVLIYSLLISKITTVHICVFPLIIATLLLKWQFFNINFDHKKFSIKEYRKQVILFIKYVPILLVLILLQLKKWGYYEDAVFLGIDEPLYVTISEYLNKLGIENTRTFYNELLANPISYVQPYHYGDLWLNALLFKVFKWIQPIYIYQFVYIPILLFILFLSYLMIAELTNNVNIYTIILSFLFLFLIGYFPYHKIGINGLAFFDAPIFNNPKTFPSFVALSFCLKYMLENNFRTVAITLLLLPIVNILYIAIIPPVLIVLFIYLYSLKLIEKKEIGKLIVLTITTLTSICLFYYLFGNNIADFATTSNGLKIDLEYLKKSSHSIFRVYLTRPVYFILFFITIGLLMKDSIQIIKRIKHYLLLSITFILTGVLLCGAFINHRESWQFVANTMTPSIYVILFFFITNLFKQVTNKQKYHKLFVFSLVLIQLSFSTYYVIKPNGVTTSKKFISEINQQRRKMSGIGVFLANKNISFESEFMSAPQIAYFADFIKLINKDTWVISLSIPLPDEINDLTFTNSTRFIKESPFYKYVENRMRTKNTISRGKLQAEFIDYYKISFAVIQKGVDVPSEVEKFIGQSFTDFQSGTRVIIFNQ